MRYYTYQVKMPDSRGGFPGFTSKTKPIKVDGVVHMLFLDETKYNEETRKSMAMMIGNEVVKADISRPFSPEEYEKLPQQNKEKLQKNGWLVTAIPCFSS